MENKVDKADLLKRLFNVNLSEDQDEDRPVSKKLAALASFGKPAVLLAHGKKEAVWWYNLNSQKLYYSETATSHKDRKAFSELYADYPEDRAIDQSVLDDLTKKGWVRGRVFKAEGGYYTVIYLGNDNLTWAPPINRNLLAKTIRDLDNQIQDNFKHGVIIDVVDEYSRSLLKLGEHKKA